MCALSKLKHGRFFWRCMQMLAIMRILRCRGLGRFSRQHIECGMVCWGECNHSTAWYSIPKAIRRCNAIWGSVLATGGGAAKCCATK